MQFFKKSKSRAMTGFSLVEIIVVVLIVSILSAVAIPKYLATRNKAYYQTASNDGASMYQEITNVLSDTSPDFGSTNGTIAYDPTTNTVTIALGAGATSPGSFVEKLSNGTTVSGTTYASTLNWCIDVVNNSQHAIYNQDGSQSTWTSCPIGALSYSGSAFTIGTGGQVLSPVFGGGNGNGTKTYTVTSGSLPSILTLDPTAGTITGPASTAWNFIPTKVASGYFHVCALTSVGGVKCWGYNNDGELGNGANTTSSAPVDVTGLTSGVTNIAVGYYTSCALLSTGAVKCWGYGANGALGNGTTTSSNVPVQVTGLASGVASITAGNNSACVVTTGGGAKCWGLNNSGQLGNNSTKLTSTPVDVSGLTSGVASISTNGNESCAVTTGGGAKCWGLNANGQLGNNSTTQSLVPVDVTGLTSGVASISVGGTFSCALTTGGGAKCWGVNNSGQLGNGNNTQQLTAVDVTGLTSGVASLSSGNANVCALTTGGGAKCWGYAQYGQNGDGTIRDRNTPVDVTGLTSGVASITGGMFSTSCAILTTTVMKCWGFNNYGELGDGNVNSKFVPTALTVLTSGVAKIFVGIQHACAVTTTGGAKCWGANTSGQLGNGTTTSTSTPTDVTGLTSGVSSMALGNGFSCALLTTGAVKCWGTNGSGQLGNGNNTQQSTPVAVSGLSSGVTQITAGASHACAINASGGVVCWGIDLNYQLGDGLQVAKNTPTAVVGLASGVSQIAAENISTCALITATGGIKCWGGGTSGQLGNNTSADSSTIVDVTGLTSGVAKLADSSPMSQHTCAITTGGGLKCWGYNSNGQVGDGTSVNKLTPVDVTGLTSGVASVALNSNDTCAVLTSGAAQCWGYGQYGVIGDGTPTSRLTPTAVSGLSSGVSQIAAGSYSTCEVNTSNVPMCWGRDFFGELGDGAYVSNYQAVTTLQTGPQPGFPATITIQVSDTSGTTSTTLTLTAS